MILTVIEVSALVLAVWPPLRLWRSRKLAVLFGIQQRWLAGFLLGYMLTVGLLAAWFPGLLHLFALMVLLVSAILAWRARNGYGKSQGMPPGSLSLTQSLAALTDRNYYLEQTAKNGPVFKMAQFHKPVVCIIGLERGFRLFREHRRALGPSKQPFDRVVKGGFLRYMDDQVHGRYGPLFMKALAAKNLATFRPLISSLCQESLGQMAADCRELSSGAFAPGAYCEQLTFDALLLTLFGLSKDMPEYQELSDAYPGLGAYSLAHPISAETNRSLEQLRQFLTVYCADLPESSLPNQRHCTLRVLQSIDPEMPDEVCIDNLLFMLKIASNNVSCLLQWIFKTLADNSDWMEKVRLDSNQPKATEQRTLHSRIVDETLRMAQSEYLYRELTKDVSFEGHTLPRGWLVRLCVWESHRSCPAFDQPEQFNPDRFAGREFSRDEYAPFGYGKHACNGAQLARLIAGEFTRVLGSDFEIETTGDGPVERDFRHWSHWRPSAHFKVKLTQIAPAERSARHSLREI